MCLQIYIYTYMINNTFDITSDTCDAPSHSNPILRDGTALIPPWLWPDFLAVRS